MNQTVLVGMCATMVFGGCSTLSYQEPQSGPRARVRFVTDASDISILRAYDDVGCESNERELMRLRVGYIVNSSPKSLGMPLWNFHPNAAKEVFVDVTKPVFYLFQGASATVGYPITTVHKCAVPFNFHFEAGQDYEVMLHWHPEECQVVVNGLNSQGGQTSRSKLLVIRNELTAETHACLDQLRKKRLD